MCIYLNVRNSVLNSVLMHVLFYRENKITGNIKSTNHNTISSKLKMTLDCYNT